MRGISNDYWRDYYKSTPKDIDMAGVFKIESDEEEEDNWDEIGDQANDFGDPESDAEDEKTIPRLRCYICGTTADIYPLECYFPRITCGVYSGEGKMSNKRFWRERFWGRYYRMILFQPGKNICKLSGISYNEGFSRTQVVPWDTDKGFIDLYNFTNPDSRLFATATVHQAPEDPPLDQLTGFAVHTRCWELLCTHRVWTLAEQNLKTIMRALRFKSANDWTFEEDPDDPRSDENDPWFEDGFYDRLKADYKYQRWAVHGPDGRPFCTPRVEKIIRKARRKSKKRFEANHATRLSQVPAEVLSLIADHLRAPDVVSIQKAVGSYLGDAYWRSRISTSLFHEIRELSVSRDPLNWEYLASKLEQACFDKKFEGRIWVIKQLDELARMVIASSEASDM